MLIIQAQKVSIRQQLQSSESFMIRYRLHYWLSFPNAMKTEQFKSQTVGTGMKKLDHQGLQGAASRAFVFAWPPQNSCADLPGDSYTTAVVAGRWTTWDLLSVEAF